MRFEIAITIYLQPYNTLQDVIKLALKVEALNKYEISITTKSTAKEGCNTLKYTLVVFSMFRVFCRYNLKFS